AVPRRATRRDLRRALSATVFATAYDATESLFGPTSLPADTAAATPPLPGTAPLDSVPSPPQEPVAPVAAASGLGPEWLKLHGGASISGEPYRRDGVGSPTRPFHSGRVTPGLSLGLMQDRLRIPRTAL